MELLAGQPRPSATKKLVGGWRVRTGAYRIASEIQDAVLLVLVWSPWLTAATCTGLCH